MKSSTLCFQTVGCSLYIILFLVSTVTGDGGCRDEVLKCFNCNSLNDPRCHDPFNYTERIDTVECRGWCAKIVENIGTENERVQRTCTDQMHINPFIVGNMCMEESSGHGSLCFCRKDRCNGTAKLMTSIKNFTLSFSIILALSQYCWS